MDDSDNDSDDWAKEDLPELPLSVGLRSSEVSSSDQHYHMNDDNDDGWEQKLEQTTNDNTDTQIPNNVGEPMILVDMTTLSQRLSLPEIHCRFDQNAVNDVMAVKALRQQIERQYDTYSKNMDYIAERIIIPCGSSVYRPALIELRKECPGHYYAPIFLPKK